MPKLPLQQLTALIDEVLTSSHSDFYREKYNDQVAVPATADEAWWQSIPFLERDEILHSRADQRLFADTRDVAMVRLTSGTSGRGVLVVPRLVSEGHQAKLFQSIFSEYTFKRMASFSGAYFRYAEIYKKAYGTDVIGLPLSDATAAYNLVRRFQPDVLFGFGYAIEALGHQMTNAERNNVHGVFLFGERVSSLRREVLEQLFPEAVIMADYSSVDAQTPIGLPCVPLIKSRSNYVHPIPEYVYTEVVDPDSGAILSEVDAVGELVVTTLRKSAFPLVRYKTGDLARIVAHECSCGTPTPVVSIEGRLDSSKVRFRHGEFQLAEIERSMVAAARGQLITLANVTFLEEKTDAGIIPKLALEITVPESISISLSELAEAVSGELRVAPETTYTQLVTRGALLSLSITMSQGSESGKSRGIIVQK